MIGYRNIITRKILIIVLVILGTLLGLFIAYKLAYYVAPFIIAFVISSLLEPLIGFIVKKTKLSRKVAAPVTLLFFIVTFGFLLVLAIIKLIGEIKTISSTLPGFFARLYETSTTLMDKAVSIYEWLPEEVANNLESIIVNMTSSLMNVVNSLVNTVVKGAFSTAVSLPEILIFILVTIVAIYFLSSDRDRISNYFRSQFPDAWVDKAISIKNDMFAAMFGYLRALLILMSITFTELFIGFSIIGVKYALLLAFIVSIVDALPVLGTGTVLIPWAIYSFFAGNVKMGFSVLILYIIVLIVRQMIEPKIVSKQIGIYPLLTLMAMYAGLKFFGVAGLILGPITLLLLKNILSGMLKNRSIKEIVSISKKNQSQQNQCQQEK